MRKKVDRVRLEQVVSVLAKDLEIPRESRGIAGNVNDTGGPQQGSRDHCVAESAAWRIDDQDVGALRGAREVCRCGGCDETHSRRVALSCGTPSGIDRGLVFVHGDHLRSAACEREREIPRTGKQLEDAWSPSAQCRIEHFGDQQGVSFRVDLAERGSGELDEHPVRDLETALDLSPLAPPAAAGEHQASYVRGAVLEDFTCRQRVCVPQAALALQCEHDARQQSARGDLDAQNFGFQTRDERFHVRQFLPDARLGEQAVVDRNEPVAPGLVEPQAASLEAQAEAVAVPVNLRRRGHVPDVRRINGPDTLEGIDDGSAFGEQLRRIVDVLPRASPAFFDERTRRRHSHGRSNQHFDQVRLEVRAMIALHAGADAVAGSGAFDEHDSSIETSDGRSTEGQRIDRQLNLHCAGVRGIGAFCKRCARRAALRGVMRTNTLRWVKLTVLGSGDAFCSAGALHSCNVVESAGGKILLECGPAVLAGLKRHGIPAGSIDAVVVSHLHGDHFGGIPFLFLEYLFGEPRKRPLSIVGPPTTGPRSFALYAALYRELQRFELPFRIDYTEMQDGSKVHVAGFDIESFLVPHNAEPFSLGYRLGNDEGSILFSGDSSFTEEFVTRSQGVDLFLCECCSIEPGPPMHTSYRELLDNRSRLGCKRLLLTHLGADVRRIDDATYQRAYDGMVVEIG